MPNNFGCLDQQVDYFNNRFNQHSTFDVENGIHKLQKETIYNRLLELQNDKSYARRSSVHIIIHG